MTFDAFERTARQAFEAIPEQYREGIDGLVVVREAEAHPDLPEIWTLGHCDTEVYPSGFESADTVRSVIRLYWGSFRELAHRDDDFDWVAEIHETIEHEVKHHLEWLAGEDALGDVDAVMEQDYRRADGLDFDPGYHQWGEEISPGVFVAEDLIFIERPCAPEDFEKASEIRFHFQGRDYAIPRPERLGDVHFVRVEGVGEHLSRLELVLIRERSWWEDAKRMFGSSRPEVLESEAQARRIDDGRSRGPGPGDPGPERV